MIDKSSGIRVIVCSYDSKQPYHEWRPKANTLLYTGAVNERYIVAVPNQRFKMWFQIPKTFDFKGASTLSVLIDIDDKHFRMATIIKQDEIVDTGCVGVLDFFNEIDGDEERMCAMTFGEVRAGMCSNPNSFSHSADHAL